MLQISKYILTFFLSLLFLAACSTVSQDDTLVEPIVDTEKPATYEEYKAWRDQYDPDAKAYADYKAWEEQYRLWKQQQQNNR